MRLTYTNMDSNLNTLRELDSTEIAYSAIINIEQIQNYLQRNKHNLTVVTQNIRSIYGNFDDLQLNLSLIKCDVDVLILTECRLNYNRQIPLLNNYTSYFTINQLNQNDGVVAYVRNDHLAQVLEIKLTHASAIQVSISDFTILGIYRSPSNSCADNFINSLNLHLETIKTQKNILIVGDININLIVKTTEIAQQRNNRLTYLNMLAVHGLLPGHCLPTREQNCLDHTFLKIDKNNNSAFVAILNTSITDHAMVLTNIAPTIKTKTQVKYKTIIDFDNSYKSLISTDFTFLDLSKDPDFIADKLIHAIKMSLLPNTTTRLISGCKRTLKPWISVGALRCIKLRNKMQIRSRKEPHNIILKITFRRFRNFCVNLIKRLKRKYQRDQLSVSMKNPKQLWQKINEFTQCTSPKSSNAYLLNITPHPLDSINRVNQFFVKIGKILAEDIINKFGPPNRTLNSHSQAASFVLLDTDPQEVDGILMGLDSGSSPGWDGIPTKFLKISRDFIVPLICQLANLCFATGKFPSSFKRSLITPVHKGGDMSDVNNYRPISVLTSFSKIIEKLLNNRLISYLNKHDILSNSQYGFRRGRSTQDAVKALTNEIITNVDKGNKCLTVFLDLKKAFDTVSVPILLHRLETIGIRGVALSLFKSYLCDRIQQVKIGNLISDEENITYGVPQGSVLGPTLFLIYINELCNIRSSGGRIFSYADDTAVVFTGTSWNTLKVTAELGLKEIASWLNANLLTLNINKTNFICFTPNQRTQPGADFGIVIHGCANLLQISNCNCQNIQQVSSTRYLGITVDQRLSWHPHIEIIMTRVRKLIWIFKALRHIMPAQILNKIYVALAQSVITYCIPIWGGATKIKFLDVERAQRSLIKVMYFKPYKYSTDNLYRISGLLTVRKLYLLNIILDLHKTLFFNPANLDRRRKDIVAHSPTVRTVFARRQYNTQSTYIYNKLNLKLNMYPMLLYDCKKTVTDWLKTQSYEEIELILTRIC